MSDFEGEGGWFPRSILGQTLVVVYMAILTHILQARAVTHVPARVVTHVLARVVTNVLARVIMHVHDYYLKTCILEPPERKLSKRSLARVTLRRRRRGQSSRQTGGTIDFCELMLKV